MSIFEELPEDWKTELSEELKQEYIPEIYVFLKKERLNFTIFPPQNDIFNAFKYCKYEDTKVVIIGQDPYHGINQANGLCFSVNDGMAIPPSLKNIFKEKLNDLGESFLPISGNLEHWASQGVLLLNTVLTVRKAMPNSHQNQGWEQFTDAVIKKISTDKQHVVFLLWGGNAKNKSKIIDSKRHLILTANHPSPLSANRGGWFGNKHFSQTNLYLIDNNKKPIVW